MLIPGVADTDLQRLHRNYGDGQGAGGYCNVPSGVTVIQNFLPGKPVLDYYEDALAELESKLRERGPLSDNNRRGV
jgi:hypothetical protein